MPNPRGSHVTTLNPPCHSWVIVSTPWTAVWVTSVSPPCPHPGPISTVGREPADGSGNQWIRIFVPSKEVRSWSVVLPAAGTARVARQLAGGRHVAEAVAAGREDGDPADGDPEEDGPDEQAARTR